jgi:uncharacterized protein YggE
MKYLFIAIFCFMTVLTYGQQTSSLDRIIEVTGEAEIKTEPNIITLALELKELRKEGKIVKIEEMEPALQKVLQTIGIPAENLKVTGSSGRQLEIRKRKPDLLISKRYTLKLTDPELLNPLLSELADANINSVSISEMTSTDMDKLKTDAKVRAITDAKEKANLLVTAAGGKLGRVVQIKETESNELFPSQGRGGNMQNRTANPQGNSAPAERASPSVSLDQIRIIYKVVVKFAID